MPEETALQREVLGEVLDREQGLGPGRVALR
jgi:hypothetical protein